MNVATGHRGTILVVEDEPTIAEMVARYLQGGHRVVRDGGRLPDARPSRTARTSAIEEVEKALASEEEPQGPPPVDFHNTVITSVLDGQTRESPICS